VDRARAHRVGDITVKLPRVEDLIIMKVTTLRFTSDHKPAAKYRGRLEQIRAMSSITIAPAEVIGALNDVESSTPQLNYFLLASATYSDTAPGYLLSVLEMPRRRGCDAPVLLPGAWSSTASSS
jgi:hypothetical protein